MICKIIDTGNFGHDFFSEKNRDAVCELFEFDNEDDVQLFRQFHQNCAVTLKVIAQTKKVDCVALCTHNIRTNLMAKDLFPEMNRYKIQSSKHISCSCHRTTKFPNSKSPIFTTKFCLSYFLLDQK